MVLTGEHKEEALKRVTSSVTFHRADVLKALLEYLQVQDALGRGHEVTETEIALKVMGRGAAFSPESDSSVRTRFLALRKKLDDYYAGEGKDAHIRVDIPRGTYSLRFLANSAESAQPVVLNPPFPDPVPAAVTPVRPPGTRFILGIFTGMALLVLGYGCWALLSSSSPRTESDLMAKAWGSMLDHGSNVTIAIGTPASFFIRDFGEAEPPVGDPPYRLTIKRDAELEEWYQRTRNVPLGRSFILHPNVHSPLWGDAAAATILSRMLGAGGVSVEQVPSARIHPVGLRDRNSIIIGRPEYTDAARMLIPDDALRIEYSPKDRVVGVHNKKPNQGEPEWWVASGGLRRNHGLITVLGADNGSKKRVVLFSGINSDGSEAGARFLTTSAQLAVLDQQFRKLGYTQWPSRYQVVVRTESVDSYSLKANFEFLKVLD